jgi:hypothetical protein
MAAALAGRGGQVAVHVEEGRARDMPGEELLPPRTQLAEAPAAVDDSELGIAQPLTQPRFVDEGSRALALHACDGMSRASDGARRRA